jgi:hypothetical protein
MNVKELREKLAEYPDDMRVVLNGYEGGVEDVETVDEVILKLNIHNKWYYVSHEVIMDLEDDYSSGESALKVV